MKKNEIALLILITAISFAASYFASQAIFGGANNRSAEVDTVAPIAGDVTQPDNRIFNEQAINPTVNSSIGAPSNQQPLGQ